MNLARRAVANEMRDIAGYEGLYAVTRDGRVWAYPRKWRCGISGSALRWHSGHWLQFDQTQGYLRAPLNREGQTRFFKVHRLVAMMWVPNPLGRPEINHLDGDRKNNRAENLEWCNRSENMLDYFRRAA